MLTDDRAHAVSTDHAVVLHVKRQTADQFFGPVWIDWMCLACAARGGYGASG